MKRFLVIGLLAVIWGNTAGQHKNILLDSSGTKGIYPHNPSVAVSYRNPEAIVVGSAPSNVYYTDNRGLSWIKSKLRSPYGVFGNPALLSDFKGTFTYFHHSDPDGKQQASELFLDRIVGQQSSDGGRTWDAGASIGLNALKDQVMPRAVTDRKGNMYVAWTEFDELSSEAPACQSRILFSQSSNGTKYSKPRIISQQPGNCRNDDNTALGAWPAATVDGKIFIVWANQEKIFMDRSFDGGTTWLTNDIVLTNQPGGWSMNIPGVGRSNGLPVLVCDQSKGMYSGALYLVWTDDGEGDADIWFMRSFNMGDNWTSPIRIHIESKGHQFMPAMTVDPSTGFIYVVYYDQHNYDDDRTDVYLAWSTDNGTSFKNTKISESPFKPTADANLGEYIGISVYNEIIVPVWTRMDNGKTSIWSSILIHRQLAGQR
ncbi:MAG: exo-alpha-sialidase [Flammeovirgaceae bacterium]|nr:MAG: exo-alpha-sialidase [Flammeovirgaceae bacterium]